MCWRARNNRWLHFRRPAQRTQLRHYHRLTLDNRNYCLLNPFSVMTDFRPIDTFALLGFALSLTTTES